MKRFFSFAFAIALVSGGFAACTMDFNQFTPGNGGTAGTAGAAGTATAGAAGTFACTEECCEATDCPKPVDPCMQATCTANACGEEAIADGTESSQQTPGDCKKAVCNGGVAEDVNDDTDSPAAANACVTGMCANGTPSPMPTMAGTACDTDGGKVCDGGGKCVECNDDTHCMADPTKSSCDTGNHICVPGDCNDSKKNGEETDIDCGGSMCGKCGDGEDCGGATDCQSGVCAPSNKCSAPACNDNVENGNESDNDCGGDCPGCDNGKKCDGDDSNCKSDYCGPGDVCTMKTPTGGACMSGDTCESDHCFQGVCCATTCFGECRSCNLMGSVGTCTNAPANTDPKDSCDGNETCNGQGACAEPNGDTCAADGDCVSGHCEDGVCCNTACGGLCQACVNAKTGMADGTCANITVGTDPDDECTDMLNCDAAGACEKGAKGVPCGNVLECMSNFCVDGVCCESACLGTCKACSNAKTGGMDGTCANVATGTDPDNECAGMMNCNNMAMCSN